VTSFIDNPNLLNAVVSRAKEQLYLVISDSECRYAANSATYLDFLLYNAVSKKPVPAVEVDGCHFHQKGTRQAERDEIKNHILEVYDIPLLRFPTNGSEEETKLTEKLKEIMGEA
jgi:hypothetical protein